MKLNKQQSELLDKALESYEVKESKNNLSAKQQMVFIASQMTSDDLLGNARQEGEDFEEYKQRRKLEQLWTKMHLQGKFAWVAVDYQEAEIEGMMMNNGGGTYKKELYGEFEHKKHKIEKMKARKVKKALGKIEEQLESK
jgi:hypothetical protein